MTWGVVGSAVAGTAASKLVGGMFGGGGNSGSYQENTPYVPRERPSYMPTQQQYMMPSYYSPFSYGRYQAPAQAPFMPAPALAQPRGMMGGMNLIGLEGLFSEDNFAMNRSLTGLQKAGFSDEQINQLMMLGSSGIPVGQLKPSYIQDVYRRAGIDPNQMITMDGKPYLIGGNMAPPTAAPPANIQPLGWSGSGATGFRDAAGKSVGGFFA
jgi:hypothetical protein